MCVSVAKLLNKQRKESAIKIVKSNNNNNKNNKKVLCVQRVEDQSERKQLRNKEAKTQQ